MAELANLARTVFDLKSVTASSATDTIVLRGDAQSLNVLNATYADMLGGGSDVLLDVDLYEIDKTNTRNIGIQLPASAGVFSIAAEAAQLVSANQSIIDQAIAAGLIKLTGNSITDLVTEVGFLIASGAVSATQYTNLLGIFGNGLTLAGLYVSSGSTLNLLLNSNDVRMLDAVQLRSGDRQAATFRAGSRYPIITSTYTAGISSSLASAAAGLNINGTNVGSLLQQYLGTSSVTVPQVQFEDLGLTLKATPTIQHDRSVLLQLDLKIESLGAGSLNGIPVLNNRELTSTVTVPAGQTALMASEVSASETRDVQGLPGLSELPGFQGTTNSSTEKDTGELLISITPHIIRENSLQIASRPLLVPHSTGGNSESFTEPPPEPQEPPAPPARPPLSPPATPSTETPIGTPIETPATPPQAPPSS
jgi:type II secretory pathway component GspD/PulD (secretin)